MYEFKYHERRNEMNKKNAADSFLYTRANDYECCVRPIQK